ncbi:hypothetical protein ACFVAJ_08850 [Agromyces sp. NPDC057679]
MDWTFWVGLGVIVVVWVVVKWAFSARRTSEKARGRNPEAADGVLDAERAREQAKDQSKHGPTGF